MQRRQQPAASGEPLLLRVVYTFFPKRYADKILPSTGNVSFGRQAAAIFGVTFLVGASMEMFMIMTGFYEVATRKEAERRAMIEWELEDNARLREERRRRRDGGGAEEIQSKHELVKSLEALRQRERQDKVTLDDEKAKLKALIKAAK